MNRTFKRAVVTVALVVSALGVIQLNNRNNNTGILVTSTVDMSKFQNNRDKQLEEARKRVQICKDLLKGSTMEEAAKGDHGIAIDQIQLKEDDGRLTQGYRVTSKSENESLTCTKALLR